MILLFGVVLLFAITGLKKTNDNQTDYMSVNMTNSIKGIFLCMVFFSHIWTYADFVHPYLDAPYQLVRRVTGQCIVAVFLFYSGYGIMESIKKKGKNYVRKIPVHRFLKVLLLFDSALAFYFGYRYLTGSQFGVKKIILTLVGWDSIGNSNWYIFCVLWLYIFTFITFTVFGLNHRKAVFGIFVLSLLYMAIVCALGKEYWWYDTILCYFWGMLFSLYRGKAEHFINENFWSWLFFVLVFATGFISLHFYKNFSWVVYQLWVFCFLAFVITFTMRYMIDSRFLRGGGANLFELYILQRLPMMILQPRLLSDKPTALTKYIYVISCIIITVLLSVAFRETIDRLITKLINWLSKFFEDV